MNSMIMDGIHAGAGRIIMRSDPNLENEQEQYTCKKSERNY